MDTPGHVNFIDEVMSAIRVSDGIILTVDAAEGVVFERMYEIIIKQALKEGLNIILCLTKIDRLIVEQKLPPKFCYLKLRFIIAKINSIIHKQALLLYQSSPSYLREGSKIPPSGIPHPVLSPVLDNVIFSSSAHQYIFTISSFISFYLSQEPSLDINKEGLVQRMWGDWFYDESNNTITRSDKSKGMGFLLLLDFIIKYILFICL